FVLEGSHDGFTHLPGQPRHIRRIEVSDCEVRILDFLEGTTNRRALVSFLLHPEVIVSLLKNEAHLSIGDTVVVMKASQTLSLQDAVWWPDMGSEAKTHRLVIVVPPGISRIMTSLRMSASTVSSQGMAT